MPELPEVETIKLGLQKRIIGLKIQKIQILSPKSFLGNPNEAEGQPFDYAQGLQGRKVLNIWRRAKILGIDLGSESTANRLLSTAKSRSQKSEVGSQLTLLIHLKMSGQLIWEGDSKFIGGHPTEDMLGKMPNKHTRVIFSFTDGSHLYFNDLRKFGWIKVTRSVILSERSPSGLSLRPFEALRSPQALEEVEDESKDLKNLGPEPLEKEFTWQVLRQNLLKHPNFAIKVAIMDQSVVAGVGNIYSNEACFDAKIDPRTKVKDLTDKQFQALYKGIIKALNVGIEHGGSTRANFVDAEGNKGYFLDYAFVYGRDGKPCKVCGTEIKKITLGGRGTYVCEHCQD